LQVGLDIFRTLLLKNEFLHHAAGMQKMIATQKQQAAVSRAKVRSNTLDLSGLFDSVPYVMLKMAMDRAKNACQACWELSRTFKFAGRPCGGHTCELSDSGLFIPREMKENIMLELRKENKLWHMMMILRPWGNETNFARIVEFDQEDFLNENEMKLWQTVKSLYECEFKSR